MTENQYTKYDEFLLERINHTTLKYRGEPSDLSNDELNQIANVLIGDGLIEKVRFPDKSSPDYMLTEQGKFVNQNGGYKAFKTKILEKEERADQKEILEIRHLKQSVRINQWQFWIMIIGSIGGLISFIFLVYQFFFGSDGFMNDIFK